MAVSVEEKRLGLKDAGLFRQCCYINGEWVAAASGKSRAVHNPATGEQLGSTPDLSSEEVAAAIRSAERSWAGWRALTAEERADVLMKWYQLMLEHREDLARLMTLEQGKPLVESLAEISYGASFVRWFAEEARRVYGDVIPCA